MEEIVKAIAEGEYETAIGYLVDLAENAVNITEWTVLYQMIRAVRGLTER